MFSKKNQVLLYASLGLTLAFCIWWIAINFFGAGGSEIFSDAYSVILLFGGIGGLLAGRKWGFFKSRLGAAISYFALGLILQFLGHFIYMLYYRIGGVELAYPSVGDIPFVLTGIVYVLAVYNLLKVIVVRGSIFKPLWVLFISVAATLLLAWGMYISFFNLAITDPRGTIYSVVNAVYPIIQAFYFVIGLIAVLQAKRMAGGKMLLSVSVMLFALIVQYAADFSFLYQSYHDTWEAAGTNDLLYIIAYGLMVLAILLIDRVRTGIYTKPTPEPKTEAVPAPAVEGSQIGPSEPASDNTESAPSPENTTTDPDSGRAPHIPVATPASTPTKIEVSDGNSEEGGRNG